MADDAGSRVAAQKKRADQVWNEKSSYQGMITDCYDYCIPHRRPGGRDKSKRPADKIFDMTATMSTMYFAGNLQRDLFPSGRPPFSLEAGPVAQSALGKSGTDKLNRMLERQSERVYPFFLTGDWDTAIHETCIDLGIGTGAIMPIKGDRNNPVLFVAIPFEDIAVKCDGWGRHRLISWKQTLGFEAILEAFPDGTFSEEFRKKAKESPYSETELYQDFARLPDGRWRFFAYTEHCETFIAAATYRTQPIAVPRYYRVPGEAYGRGPVMLAMPSIKTLNKAQELALKSAAIQMLGIWGYRAGGTFNPNTVRVGPGEFWPMQSTGGMLGPDVSRIDPASGRIDVARLVIGGLQDQIKQSLFDYRLPENQGNTPKSASEIVARLQQKAEVHIGAFGRLVREIMPVIVPRVMEILYEFGFLDFPLTIDQFMVATKVQSPMAAALNADRLASVANYLEFVGSVAPDAMEQYVHIDRVLELVGDGLQIPKNIIPSDEERAQIRQRQEDQQAILLAAQAAASGAGGEPQRMAA